MSASANTALKAAKEETEGDAPVIEHFGKKLRLPVRMPFSVIDAAAMEDAVSVRRAALQLLGEKPYQALLEEGVAFDDMVLFLADAAKVYGFGSPEV